MRSTSRTSATAVLGTAARLVVNLAALCGAVAAAAVVVALLTGVRPMIFLSGSMGPGIEAGALAITVPVNAGDIHKGQVVSVVREDGVRVTHRVVRIEREDGRVLVTMRGDANPAPDQEHYDVTDGASRVVWHANGLGRVLTSLKAAWAIGAAALLLVIAAFPRRAPAEGAQTVSR